MVGGVVSITTQRPMCQRLGPQPVMLVGGGGTFKRCGPVGGSEVSDGVT